MTFWPGCRDDDGDWVICVWIAGFEATSSATETIVVRPMVSVRVNEEFWDEIDVENRGEVSVRYEWKKEENEEEEEKEEEKEKSAAKTLTEHGLALKPWPLGEYFYFDSRPGILGPGQSKRVSILFKPKTTGQYKETWTFRADVLGRWDPVARVKMYLQGCGVPGGDDDAVLKGSINNNSNDKIQLHSYVVSAVFRVETVFNATLYSRFVIGKIVFNAQ